nr:immunoglobulin light chain junction region [Macaca mulatta]
DYHCYSTESSTNHVLF